MLCLIVLLLAVAAPAHAALCCPLALVPARTRPVAAMLAARPILARGLCTGQRRPWAFTCA